MESRVQKRVLQAVEISHVTIKMDAVKMDVI